MKTKLTGGIRAVRFLLRRLASLHRDEPGQGLVEYVFVITFVALAATAGMSAVATKIDSVFSAVGSLFGTSLT
jgi:Flp pilus assembly pilin Flp